MSQALKKVSVSRVLAPYFDASKIHPDRLSWAAERGTAVHAACEAYAKGLPVLSLMPEAQPFFDSFRAWFGMYVKRVYFAEDGFYDPVTYGIVGHPDLVCELADDRLVVVDYKTPAVESRTWRAQIAAYCYLVGPAFSGRQISGMALMLDKSGGPARAKTYRPEAGDWAAFLAALQAYRWFVEEAR
jgi:hypothetical protein